MERGYSDTLLNEFKELLENLPCHKYEVRLSFSIRQPTLFPDEKCYRIIHKNIWTQNQRSKTVVFYVCVIIKIILKGPY